MRAWPLVASLLTHGLVFAAAGLAAFLPAAKAQKQPPPPVPVVVLTPPPAPSPPPRRQAQGDMPVRPKATPTPQPTPTPRPTPRPTPKATPTPKPTPKASPTPTPEQRQFKTMRQIPYFKHMTDEELRKQKVPPGMKDWGEVIEMGKKLDGLNWLFLPPETGAPEGGAQPTAVPSALPTPREEVDDEGMHTLTFQQEDQVFTARWKEGDEKVAVTHVPAPAPGASTAPSPSPGAEKTFEVPYAEDREQLLANILSGYIESLFAAPSPSP